MKTSKTKEWTGESVRDLRESMKLTRKQFAQYLNVSAVAVEKWELAPAKKLQSKYSSLLGGLSKQAKAGGALAMLAAPTVAAPALLGGLAMDIVSNKGLKETIEKLEGLQKLSEEERATLVQLWLKMSP
jgi:transcriptional regulator with XRE-family HTH domain